jgi:hypothetical protein
MIKLQKLGQSSNLKNYYTRLNTDSYIVSLLQCGESKFKIIEYVIRTELHGDFKNPNWN